MKLQEKIHSDLKNAMINKDNHRKDLLRVLIGEINREGKELSDERIIKIIKKMSENALIMNNQLEIDILSEYLPKMLTEQEIDIIISEFIMNNNITDIKQMGLIMKFLKDKYGTLIDGKIANSIIKEKLK